MLMPILVLAFIAAETAAAVFSLRAESLAVTRSSAFGEYLVRRVSIGESVAPRIRNVVLSARRVQWIYAFVTSG